MLKHKHTIATFLLVIFGVTQLADLHALSHDDDLEDTDCHVCTLAFDNLDDDCTIPEIVPIPVVVNIPADVVRAHYDRQYFNITLHYSFLNKAPPSIG